MSAATEAAVGSVANMIGQAFTGASAPVAAPEPAQEVEKFDFDAEFQSMVAANALRNDDFMRRTAHLLQPEFFEDIGEASLVNLALEHHRKYRAVPTSTEMVQIIRDATVSKVLSKEVLLQVVPTRKKLLGVDLGNASFVESKIVEFAKHQAVSNAILRSVALLNQGKFPAIETLIKQAIEIGANEEGDGYDYFSRIDERTDIRKDKAAGLRPPQGITTGVAKMDEILYHRGWGRKELTSIMGGAKAGKTTALINFAKSASIAGHNVLYVTLEVGANIIGDRLDACLAGVLMKELGNKIHLVEEAIEEIGKKSGKLVIHEFASGTCTPNMLRKLVERYKSPGRNRDGTVRPPINFDLLVVDYADIMAPNFRTQDAIENSKSVYVDLRAIAFEENVAVLTATQTNREGYKSAVAKAEHVAEDFNKVRTVDLMISINKTEEEAARGEARLYFAASRNQESGFTIVVKQNLSMMQFCQAVLRVE